MRVRQARSSVVEHHLDMVGVVGSKPIAPTRFRCRPGSGVLPLRAGFSPGNRTSLTPEVRACIAPEAAVQCATFRRRRNLQTGTGCTEAVSRGPGFLERIVLPVFVVRLEKESNIVQSKRVRRNDEITAAQVRVIGANGEQVGILSLEDALASASGLGLDLVEVAPNSDPPVCRVMDYGKFVFEQNKKAQSARRKQKQIHVKEVKFRPGTEESDYQVKLRNLVKFLTQGDKTKVTLRFRGREMAHQELGAELLARVRKDLEEYGTVEQFPLMEGRQMVMVIAPRKR